MATKTGQFPIGFRRGWGAWQKDLPGLIAWAQRERFAFLDLGKEGDVMARTIIEAGMRIGSVDLAEWKGMLSADVAIRAAAVERNTDYVQAVCAVTGPMRFFLVMLPEDPTLPGAQHFDYLQESFGALIPVLEATGSHLVVEGWPGPGALACTPETVRRLFEAFPSPALGYNYDPSHLVRQGIDAVRFLREFVGHVHHVHAKDTAINAGAQYLYGTEKPGVFAKPHGFGGHIWRYTLPGLGACEWSEIFKILADAHYTGGISIELEDENFNGTEEGEKRGLQESLRFLSVA